jgi:hypothetical protein
VRAACRGVRPRSAGTLGYQTLINQVLAEHVRRSVA